MIARRVQAINQYYRRYPPICSMYPRRSTRVLTYPPGSSTASAGRDTLCKLSLYRGESSGGEVPVPLHSCRAAGRKADPSRELPPSSGSSRRVAPGPSARDPDYPFSQTVFCGVLTICRTQQRPHDAWRAGQECRERAESGPTTVALGRTGLQAKAEIPLRVRNGLHRPNRSTFCPSVHRQGCATRDPPKATYL
jgi:hypothetical protein